MQQSKLVFSTSAEAPIAFSIYQSHQTDFSSLHNLIDSTQKILSHPLSGFNDLNAPTLELKEVKNVLKLHKNKKHFIHIGMGGSILSAEMMIDAFGKKNESIIFLNNLDADYIHLQLQNVDLAQSVIFVVSKSGNTLETKILMNVLFQKLKNHPSLKNVSDDKIFNDHFVFATDPVKSELKTLSQKHQIPCLSIPTNLGGRFCALSSVAFFPAEFCSINCEQLLAGASVAKKYFLGDDKNHSIFKFAQIILDHYREGIDQTVMMPYSSLLRSFNSWFAQLWSESLGKISNKQIQVGLTPILAYGPADQHSQLQLFMQGPKNKFCIFIKLNKNHHEILINNNASDLSLLNQKTISNISQAQLTGTMAALQRNSRPFISMEIAQLDEYSLGSLIYFFELLTVIVGAGLNIDPFDQPGVELGKTLTWNFLKDGKSPLLN